MRSANCPSNPRRGLHVQMHTHMHIHVHIHMHMCMHMRMLNIYTVHKDMGI